MHIKLKEIRTKNKITSDQMAKMLNISKPYYSQIENERRGLSYNLALKISNIFNLKPDDIFYDEHKNILNDKKSHK